MSKTIDLRDLTLEELAEVICCSGHPEWFIERKKAILDELIEFQNERWFGNKGKKKDESLEDTH